MVLQGSFQDLSIKFQECVKKFKKRFKGFSRNNKGCFQGIFRRFKGYWHERAVFQRSSVGWLTAGYDVVASIFTILPPPFFLLCCDLFSQKDWSDQKLLRTTKNLGVDTFPDLVGHFGAPWQPFWIFEVLKEGVIKSKNLFRESCSGGPITYDLTFSRPRWQF